MKFIVLIAFLGMAKIALGADVVIKGIQTDPVNKTATVVYYHTGLVHSAAKSKAKAVDFTGDPDCAALPDHFDLLTDVTPSPVSPIRDQGQCGSCWAHSKTGALESFFRVSKKGDYDLSEQELVSNDGSNWGCNGGLLNPGEEYQSRVGQGLEQDFPYRAADVARKTIPEVGQGPDFELVGGSGATKEMGMKCAIFKYHTVPWITVGADNDWGSPSSTDGTVWTQCSSNQTNHAIGYTGWKTVNGKTYFHIKNSWGTSWGQKGYAWMALGCDGLGEEVAFMPASPAPPVPPVPPTPPTQWTCTAKGWGATYSASDALQDKAKILAVGTCKMAGGWFCSVKDCAQTPIKGSL